MEKETLYKYFDGKASDKEKKDIHEWLESSPSNMDTYLAERELFDATILLAEPLAASTNIKQRSLWRTFSLEVSKIAAVALIIISIGMYVYNNKIDELSNQINTVKVPSGQRANVILPDGSTVWLNARSELRYPSVFTDGRNVSLKGEGYFEVVKDNGKSFKVQTDNCEIEVLGTKFNVEAYDGEFTTSLIEGSVKITEKDDEKEAVILKPNNKATLKDGKLDVSPITDYDTYRWKEGLICFKNASFTELMNRFEKCYGIRIVIQNKNVEKYVCSGKFRISDGIDMALRILQKDAKYTFERDGEDSTIYIR
jgi:ferric-dicitrate binding protein FerR (iron transport regulator)